MMSSRALGGMIVASLALVPIGSATAQDGWHGEITPYLWGAGIEGDATVAGRKVDVDVSFDELLDNMDVGGSILGLLYKDRLVFAGQIDYLDLSFDVETPGGISGDLASTSTIWTLAAGYHFGRGSLPGQGRGHTLDLLVGARQLSLDNELSLDGLPGNLEGDQTLTDAVLVVNPVFFLSDRWRFSPGFSYGAGDSDVTWSIAPQFQYLAGDAWQARIGYRKLYYELEGDRDNEFDAAFHGYLLGIGFLF